MKYSWTVWVHYRDSVLNPVPLPNHQVQVSGRQGVKKGNKAHLLLCACFFHLHLHLWHPSWVIINHPTTHQIQIRINHSVLYVTWPSNAYIYAQQCALEHNWCQTLGVDLHVFCAILLKILLTPGLLCLQTLIYDNDLLFSYTFVT